MFITLLQILFIGLKLTGFIDWNWFLVFSSFLLEIFIALFLIIMYLYITRLPTMPKDLNTDMEDHAVDTLRYLCMTKPIIPAEIKKPMTLQESINKELEIQKLIDKIKEENKLLTKNKR